MVVAVVSVESVDVSRHRSVNSEPEFCLCRYRCDTPVSVQSVDRTDAATM